MSANTKLVVAFAAGFAAAMLFRKLKGSKQGRGGMMGTFGLTTGSR